MMKEGAQLFLTTRWTLLDKVKRPEAADALDELCRRYWGPVFRFLKRLGCSDEDAEDLAQEFFRDFLARDGFGQAEREKGRFRSFLLRSVRNHFANARKAAGRLKRGGGMEFIAVNDELDSDDRLSPDEAFDKRWAEDLVDRALVKLRDEWQSAGRPFEVLMPYLSGDRGSQPLAETAEMLGVSLAAVKSSVHRLRKRFGELVREEVSSTIGSEGDADGELEHLLQLLSR
ncbi:MAG: sigma-70 family RNA polymerase sigma factor [Verrucomicrobiota bacterium]